MSCKCHALWVFGFTRGDSSTYCTLTYFQRQCAGCSDAQQKQHSYTLGNISFLSVPPPPRATSSRLSSRTVTLFKVVSAGERTPLLTAEMVFLRLLCVCSLIQRLFPAVNSQWRLTVARHPDIAPDRLTAPALSSDLWPAVPV